MVRDTTLPVLGLQKGHGSNVTLRSLLPRKVISEGHSDACVVVADKCGEGSEKLTHSVHSRSPLEKLTGNRKSFKKLETGNLELER